MNFKMKTIDAGPITMPFIPVHTNRWAPLLAITLLVTGILLALHFSGHLNNIHLDKTKTIITISVPTIAVLGCSYVFYRAIAFGHAKNLLSSQWYTMHRVFYDASGIDSEGSGEMKQYEKPILQARLTGGGLVLFVPFYIIGCVVYHLIRLVIIPFYILFRMAQESSHGKPFYENDRFFNLSDIPKQMLFSIKKVIQAPLYGTALVVGGIYTVIDPLNGVKLVAAIEYDWNDRVPLENRGIWMMQGFKAQEDWKFEGGGKPSTLGQNGFYAAGSYQPTLKYIFNKGILVKKISVTNSKIEFL